MYSAACRVALAPSATRAQVLGGEDLMPADDDSTTLASAACPAPVVVIDDDPDILSLLVIVLGEEAGMTVFPARSVDARLGSQSRSPDPAPAPALILLDMSLPDENLHDAVQRLRAHPGWGCVPIILCSGREDIVAAANALAAAGYLRKPFDVDAVI